MDGRTDGDSSVLGAFLFSNRPARIGTIYEAVRSYNNIGMLNSEISEWGCYYWLAARMLFFFWRGAVLILFLNKTCRGGGDISLHSNITSSMN